MKIAWPGFNDQRTVILPFDRRCLVIPVNPIVLDGEPFEPKAEFHVTLIGKRVAGPLLERMAHDAAVEALLEQAFQAIDWSCEQTGPVHLLSRTRQRPDSSGRMSASIEKSIVLRLKMPGMAEFYGVLKSQEVIDSSAPVPPPHITLYTCNYPRGIGVSSVEVLDELSGKILSVNEFNEWCRKQ